MTTTHKDGPMPLRKRLLTAAFAGLLVLGAAACDAGTTAEGGGTSPADQVGDDTGATGEGFDDADVDADAGSDDEG